MNDLRFFVATSDVLHSFNPSTNTFSEPASLIYSFSAGDWIKMDYSIAAGGGWTDVSALIPGFDSYDESLYYVYLYSKFGAQGGVLGNVNGAEEWSVSTGTAFIPAPGAILLGAIGIGFVRSMRKHKML